MELLQSTKLLNTIYAVGLFLVGYAIAKWLSNLMERALGSHFSRHHAVLISRASFYITFFMFFFSSLQHLGFNLNVLLGAAGVFTVAISFASQTAASNLISGIFLLFEHPFKMGDTIEVKGIRGVVDSIDLLSTKLRTDDNKLIRIPNETLIKSEITNLNFFTIRRIDLTVAVSYHCDIDHARQTLLNIARQCEHALKEPAPTVVINNFADSAIELKFMVWVNTIEISKVKNKLQEDIKTQFDQERIDLPVPQVTVHKVS